MIVFLLVLDALITIVPFILTGVFYPSMPEKIPLFVNIAGEPVVLADKSLFSAFRLPVMALILQGVCLSMYLGCRGNPMHGERSKAYFRNFWLAAALTAAFKMSASTLPYTGVVPGYLVPGFRSFTVAAALLGVLYMLLTLARMYRDEKLNFGSLFVPRRTGYTAATLVLMALYAAVAFLR